MLRRLPTLTAAVATAFLTFAGSAPPSSAASGGPDAFGYRYIDSNEPGGPAYYFLDISGTGTLADGSTGGADVSDCDDCVQTNVPIGFTFDFYGSSYTTVNISSNGNLQFGGNDSDFSNSAIPGNDLDGGNDAILPWWDDLQTSDSCDAGNDIYYATLGTAPNRRFVVQYQMTGRFFCAADQNVTFQVILHEGSDDILLQYQDAVFGGTQDAYDHGASATVGIQNTDTLALQYSYNSAVLEDGLAILFTTATLRKVITSGPIDGEGHFTIGEIIEGDDQLSDGDFQGLVLGNGDLNGAEFELGADDLDEWYVLSPFSVADDGGNHVLAHACVADGGVDQKAFQVIDASGLAPGTQVRLDFDYRFERDSTVAVQGMDVGITGLMGAGAEFKAFGGTDFDGLFGPNLDATVLATKTGLAETSGFESDSLTATIDNNYDALVVILRVNYWNCDSPGETGDGFRWFDNVALTPVEQIDSVDRVVGVALPDSTRWDFTIYYDNPEGPENVLVKDTVPAELDVTAIEGDDSGLPLGCGGETDFADGFGTVDLWRGGKQGKKCQSATHLEWMPSADGTTTSTGALYATNAGPTAAGSLYTLDPVTGSAALIGETDDAGDPDIDYAITGLAFHPVTNVLYGATSRQSETDPGHLVTIDPSNGDTTVIGGFGLPTSCALADISFDASGTLYGWAEPNTFDCDNLWTVDLTTGAAAFVGDPAIATRGSGLAFAPDGTLYSCGRCDGFGAAPSLMTINPGTGSVASTVALANGLANRNVGALDFSGTGVLYGTRKRQNAAGGGFEELVTIDTATTTLNVVADLSSEIPDVDAIAFGNAAAMLRVDLETRQSPSGKPKYKPTSCGALYLNDGATAYEKDAFGGLLGWVAGPTPPLCVAAVEDIDGGGLVGDGTGDEDGDNLQDYQEACVLMTNPCEQDSDGDGLDDDVELAGGTDPNDPDTDGDGFDDGADPCPTVYGSLDGCVNPV